MMFCIKFLGCVFFSNPRSLNMTISLVHSNLMEERTSNLDEGAVDKGQVEKELSIKSIKKQVTLKHMTQRQSQTRHALEELSKRVAASLAAQAEIHTRQKQIFKNEIASRESTELAKVYKTREQQILSLEIGQTRVLFSQHIVRLQVPHVGS